MAAASLLLNELGLYSEKGWKRKQEENIPRYLPKRDNLIPRLVEFVIFLFFLATSVGVFRKNPPVLVNRIGPVQLLGFPGLDAIRPLQLK